MCCYQLKRSERRPRSCKSGLGALANQIISSPFCAGRDDACDDSVIRAVCPAGIAVCSYRRLCLIVIVIWPNKKPTVGFRKMYGTVYRHI